MDRSRALTAKLTSFIELIKFEHTIFALPFAMIALIMVYDGHLPDPTKTFWIVLAMVSARSAAMAFNRIADYVYDTKNPRTETRPLQTRRLTMKEAWIFTVLAAFAFVFSAAMLNWAAFLLSFVALFVLFGYSYMKRFSSFSHLVLGFSLGMSPGGVWIAVTGHLSLTSLLLCGGVTFWVAGFDIFYALQDIDFDSKENLKSLPVRLGAKKALVIAFFFHVATIIFFLAAGLSEHMGGVFYVGLSIIGLILFYEHWLILKRGLAHINMAFFTLNGVVSALFFCFTFVDILISS